jgi:acyl-CoA reductase-like NAD-dependent aldehyde dehydrogenase
VYQLQLQIRRRILVVSLLEVFVKVNPYHNTTLNNLIRPFVTTMSPSKVSSISWDEFHNTVDGEPRGGTEKHYGINPSTGEKNWPVPIGNQQDVDDAVASAQEAFESWEQTPIERRKGLLGKFKDHYLSYADEMTDLLCTEAGKPKQFANYEVLGAGGLFDHHMKIEIPEERIEDEDKVLTTRWTPLGVVGAICPWNFVSESESEC